MSRFALKEPNTPVLRNTPTLTNTNQNGAKLLRRAHATVMVPTVGVQVYLRSYQGPLYHSRCIPELRGTGLPGKVSKARRHSLLESLWIVEQFLLLLNAI